VKISGKIATTAGRLLIGLNLAALLVATAGWADSWEAIRAASEKIVTVQADFVQEKHLPFLARPLTSTGRFFFQRPGSVRWEYVSPVKSILVSRQGNTRRFVEQDGRWIADAGVKMAGMQVVMGQISGWMSGRFSDSADFDAALVGSNKVVLTPKKAALSRIINRIELILSDAPGVVDTVTVVEGADAYTVWTFTHTRTNMPLPPAVFSRIP